MLLALNAESLPIALVAGVIITFVVAALPKKCRLTSPKEGYPLPPGPPARWFWDNIVPTVKSDHPAQLLSIRSTNLLLNSSVSALHSTTGLMSMVLYSHFAKVVRLPS